MPRAVVKDAGEDKRNESRWCRVSAAAAELEPGERDVASSVLSPSAGFGWAGWTLLLSGGRSQLSTVHPRGLAITLFLGCSGILYALREK